MLRGRAARGGPIAQAALTDARIKARVTLNMTDDKRYVLGVELRGEYPHHFNGAAAMRNRQDLFRVDVVLFRPPAPLTCHGAGGVDKNTVEVKKNGRTLKIHNDNLSGRPIGTTRNETENHGEAIESGGVISEASF